MNRAERRRQQRELERKTKDELSVMKKLCGKSEKTQAVDWALNLKTKEQKYLSFMMAENSKHDTQVYVEAYSMALRINLDDNKELINKINRDVEKEGYKVKEYRDNGGDYIMSLENNQKQIIKDYEKGIKKNIKESELVKDLAVNYKATQNAIKSIIKDYKKSKEKPCSSKTCPLVEEGKCTNSIVLSGKGSCKELNSKGCKVTVDKSIIKPIKDREVEKASPIIKINYETVKGNKEEVKKMEKKNKFKIVSKSIDVEGEHGIYHIKNGTVRIEDTIYTKADDIKQDYSDTVQAIELSYQDTLKKLQEDKKKQIENAESSKNEALEIMEEFM